jgi:hypothetical protein
MSERQMPETLRDAFEETMSACFNHLQDWKTELPANIIIEYENMFMAGAQVSFIKLVASGGEAIPQIDNELMEFGRNIEKRYEEAGVVYADKKENPLAGTLKTEGGSTA